MLNLTVNHDVNGWNVVFVGTFLIAAIYAARLVHNHVREKTLVEKFTAVVRDDPLRMASGFILLCFGLASRIGGWIPWRAMRHAENWPLVQWYSDHASFWTLTGALFAVVGMALIMWPAFEQKFGKWAWPAIVGIAGGFYVAGVVMVDILAPFFRP